ncbi:unnamed protein product [Owenia fusiformis]|uniref:Uncharacterized protein n=1 Tax=Owenia fusiformis TaxID=6347 RepID=A0A8J1Y0C6_OWEFU|nr:unnamed protein product [Owenia fusiformis]
MSTYELMRKISTAWISMRRRKKQFNIPESYGHTPSSTIVATSRSLGGVLAIGIYVIVAESAKEFGPPVVISLLLAGVTALLSGLCQLELVARIPLNKRYGRSLYSVLYQGWGEWVAFTIGWILILQELSIIAAVMRTISQTFDFLLGNPINTFLVNNTLIMPGLDNRIDILSPILGIVCLGILIVNLTLTDTQSVGACIVHVLTISFILIVGLFHIQFTNWATGGGFFKEGMRGVLSGAGWSMFAFAGSSIEQHGVDSQSSVTVIFGITVMSSLIIYFATGATITLLVKVSQLSSDAILAEAFYSDGANWMKVLICVVEMILLTLTLLTIVQRLPKLLMEMREDGMLFACCTGAVNQNSQNPLGLFLVMTASVSLMALIFSIVDLTVVLSLTTLLSYVISIIVVLLTRYMPCMNLETPRRSSPRRTAINTSLRKCLGSLTSDINNLKNEGYSNGFNDRTNANAGKRDGASLDDAADNANKQAMDNSSTNTIREFEPGGTNNNDSFLGEDECLPNSYQNDPQRDNDSGSDTDIDQVVDEYQCQVRLASIWRARDAYGPNLPTSKSYAIAVCSTVIFILCSIISSCLLIYGLGKIRDGNTATIFGFVISSIGVLGSGIMIGRQPQDYATLSLSSHQMPFCPLVPLVALVLNISMAVSCSSMAWIWLLAWMSIGMAVYFCYGIKHGNEAQVLSNAPDEEQVLLTPSDRLESGHRSSDD